MIIMIMIIGTDYYDYDYCCYVIYIYIFVGLTLRTKSLLVSWGSASKRHHFWLIFQKISMNIYGILVFFEFYGSKVRAAKIGWLVVHIFPHIFSIFPRFFTIFPSFFR